MSISQHFLPSSNPAFSAPLLGYWAGICQPAFSFAICFLEGSAKTKALEGNLRARAVRSGLLSFVFCPREHQPSSTSCLAPLPNEMTSCSLRHHLSITSSSPPCLQLDPGCRFPSIFQQPSLTFSSAAVPPSRLGSQSDTSAGGG